MDKTAIKKYAVWARQDLINRVKQKSYQYGITENEAIDKDADNVNGKLLSATEKTQRKALLRKISQNGFDHVIEEVAYTWFNRFCALRFMEVNGYLPSHVRVFTDEHNKFKPQILSEAMSISLPGLNIDKVFELKEDNRTEELYKYLLIVQCNALNSILPGMFQRIEDYTELLFPDNLLREGSVIEQLVSQIPENDWKDAVQIIGWLYQFYNTEPKDNVFDNLKKNIKIGKNDIPAATQLFTPDWIVRYMVENSLGRIFIDKQKEHTDDLRQEKISWDDVEAKRIKNEKAIAERMGWKYYLPEAVQTEEVRRQLEEIQRQSAYKDVRDIKVIDPCMGSGHILVYAFDVLMKMYENDGYSQRDAAQCILEHNLFGLDTDGRATQLAYFAVMMKSRQYDRSIFSRRIQPHVYEITESNDIDAFTRDYFVNNDPKLEKALESIMDDLCDAKEYGSILTVAPVDFPALYVRLQEIEDDASLHREAVLTTILPLIRVAEMLSQKYDVVVTNPPYMGGANMDARLSEFVKKHYPDSKSDLFAVFIERCGQMVDKNRYQVMITQHAWMFLSSFEKLRAKLLLKDIVNMAHLGPRAFEEIGGEVVQTTSFVLCNSHIPDYKGTYCRLIEPTTQQGKEDMFLAGENRYTAQQSNFSKIPGSPVAYWVSDKFILCFEKGRLLGTLADSKQGLATADNNRFLREWFEVQFSKIKFDARSIDDAAHSSYKWFPYNKGGEFRKWYGNNDYIVNWEDNGFEIRNFKDEKGKLRSRPQNTDFYFRESASWSLVTSSVAAFRYKLPGNIFDVAGMSFFSKSNLYYLLALCNTKVVMKILQVIAPTINYQCGDIANIPVLLEEDKKPLVITTVQDNITLSKTDWDSYETSWDFKKHPLI